MSLYDPRNRKEVFYRGILDGDPDSLPDPQTREELFLKAIAEASPIVITDPEVVQGLGDSTVNVMSQAAVTDLLGSVSSPTALTITNESTGGKNTEGGIYPNRRYRFINQTTGACNLYWIKLNDTVSSVVISLPAGQEFEVVADDFYKGIRVYFSVAGTCLFNSVDDGIFNGEETSIFKQLLDPVEFTLSVNSGSTVNGYVPILKGRSYTYTNNSAGSVNLSIVKPDITYQLIIASIPSGNKIRFTAPVSGVGIRSYFAAAGSTVLKSYDDGLIDIEGTINKVVAEREYTTVSMFESIAVVGDSYASGGVYIDEDTNWGQHQGISWPKILGRSCGSEINNYSSSGLSTRTWLTNATVGLSKALSDDPSGLYLMCLGINDGGIAGYLGTISDIHDDDYTQNADTFYGNYGKIMAQLLVHAPLSKFVFVIPPYNLDSDYVSAIKNIAEHYSVPYVVSYDDPVFQSTFWTGSITHGHPVAMTYGSMAQAYERLLSLCIQNNSSYFFDYIGATV